MFKKQHLALAIAATLAAGAAHAALETSVTLKNETARFINDGIRTGEATKTYDTSGAGKTTYKFENTAKIYLNDNLGESSTWHGELNIVRDTKAITDYQGHETSTQRDWLRELYIDTTVGDWDLRLGKQQVVWGTADGMKLLDFVNPTDWTEFNQNTMADARIPVWMFNAEKYLDNGANIQAIISQAEINKIAGLNANGDSNSPFIMKGVDAITGDVNGFMNVGVAMGKASSTFSILAADNTATGLQGYTDATVEGFATYGGSAAGFGSFCTNDGYTSGNATDKVCFNAYVNTATTGFGTTTGQAVNNNQNVLNTSGSANSDITWDPTNASSAFEYMANATFATFNTFAGNTNNSSAGTTASMTTKYVEDHDSKPNLGFRFRNTTANGMNYSFVIGNREDSNPYVDLSYHDQSTGEQLTTVLMQGNGMVLAGSAITRANVPTTLNGSSNHVSVLLKNSSGEYYGACNPALTGCSTTAASGSYNANGVEMRFTEKTNRVNNIGGSFDFAIDSNDTPVVIRTEYLYTKGEMMPVLDKRLLSIGDLEGAFQNVKHDTFKYVIGADTTVMTDMMLSGQFIQFRNLDYQNSSATCTTESTASGTDTFDCSKYTADMATMSLKNGLKAAEENKEFYSLFLSKPFGESGEGRWNNIFIYEEGGGKWNRFDVEYGFDDQLIGTFEVNKYFGDNNTMFGQFENASNVQIGVKYLLQ